MRPLRLLAWPTELLRAEPAARAAVFLAYAALVWSPWGPFRTWLGTPPWPLSISCLFGVMVGVEYLLHRWSGAATLRTAEQAHRRGNVEAATRDLKQIVTRNRRPSVTAMACTRLAAIEIEAGRFVEAFGWTDRARAFDGRRALKSHRFALEGMIHHLLGRPRDAASRLESAASLHPQRPVRGLIQLVRAALHLLHEHDPLGGLKRLERAADAGGHPLADRLFPPLTALALAESGYTDEARTVLTGAPAGATIVPFVLARIRHQEGDLAEAADAYREALEQLPEGFILHRTLTRFHLGRVYLDVGRTQQGSELLHQALRSPLPKPYRSAVPHLALDRGIG